MIHIAITAAAYDAICSTMPVEAPLMASGRPMIEAAVLDRLRAMGRPGEDPTHRAAAR
jgi:hypothetical protein